MLNRLLPLAIIALLLAPVAQAAQSAIAVGTGTGDDAQACAPTMDVISVAGVLAAGQVNACLYYDDTVQELFPSTSSTTRATIVVSGPSLPLGVVATMTATTGSRVGCTEPASPWTTVLTAGLFGFIGTSTTSFTLTDSLCKGFVRIVLTAGAAPLTFYDIQLPFAIQRPTHYSLNYDCDSTADTPHTFDIITDTCNENDYQISGTLTATLAGTLALSGTLGLSQSGSWTFAITGIPDTQQEIQAIADALAAGLDVSICPPTAPCYHVLSGELDANLDGDIGVDILDDTTDDAMLTVPTAMVDIGNQSVVFPDNLTVQGFPSTFEVSNGTSDFFAPILLWVTAFFICLRFRKLLSAGACTLGIIVSAFQLDFGWQAACIGVLGIALWLEALGKDDIIQNFFTRETPERRP